MSAPRPKVGEEIDLSLAEEHEHPKIVLDAPYLCKIGGQWFFGRFGREWYGLNFHGWHGVGLQFDAPGWNRSKWERVFKMEGLV